jgi:hypothetical protein
MTWSSRREKSVDRRGGLERRKQVEARRQREISFSPSLPPDPSEESHRRKESLKDEEKSLLSSFVFETFFLRFLFRNFFCFSSSFIALRKLNKKTSSSCALRYARMN